MFGAEKKIKNKNSPLCKQKKYKTTGSNGNRTHDLHLTRVALCQLSYGAISENETDCNSFGKKWMKEKGGKGKEKKH